MATYSSWKNWKIFKYGLLSEFFAPNFTYSSQWWHTQPENVPKVGSSRKVSKKFKILKYGLLIQFTSTYSLKWRLTHLEKLKTTQIWLTRLIYFYLLTKMETYSSWKIENYSNMAYLSNFCSKFCLLQFIFTYS